MSYLFRQIDAGMRAYAELERRHSRVADGARKSANGLRRPAHVTRRPAAPGLQPNG